MNKYLVTIPYDCVQYGKMSCYVYAEDEEDAISLAYDSVNRIDEEYEDGDQDGTNFDFDRSYVSLDSLDVTSPESPRQFHRPQYTSYIQIPDYFLAELQLL
ncbi:MAG: hypothetical protein J0M18_00385 [Ignavibacteria bacterium]|jgi:hypothetical protein|nr:hypothetical protein [Ignavibacteria bacterium]